MNPGDRIYMTELIAQLKMAEDKRDEAHKEMNVWIRRMDVAKQARDRGLWEAAREKALECEERMKGHESVIMELEVQRDNFKREVRENRSDPAAGRAAQIMENFKALGVDPDAQVLDEFAKDAEADAELAALKARMSRGE